MTPTRSSAIQKPLFPVQFHPEFGADEMRTYLEFERMHAQGSSDVENECKALETPWPRETLSHLVRSDHMH